MNKRISPNPFEPTSFELEEQIIDENAEELIDYARTLDSWISGDFKLKGAIFQLKDNTLSFVRTGLLAYKVKVYRLYQKSYSSFKEFCEQALGIENFQINRAIEAARVVMELIAAGFTILPKCEYQCRPLWKILKEFGVEVLIESWQEVIDRLQSHRITHNSICEVLGIERKQSRLQKLLNKLREKAISQGASLEDYLEGVLEDEEEVEEVEEEKLENWEKDLELLVKEHEEQEVKVKTNYRSVITSVAVVREKVINNLLTYLESIFYQVQFLT